MKTARLLGASMALLFLAACGSTGGLGDILGGMGGGGASAASEIRGVVDYVDRSARFVQLTNVSEYRSRLADQGSYGSGSTVRVYYESNTPVSYAGATYSPEDLERGDEVAVRVDQSGDRLIASSMTVLRDVSGGGTSTGSGYDTTVRGTVRYVDTSRRTIEVDRGGYGGVVTVSYDNNSFVDFQGRRYRVEDLERGDVIEIRTRDIGGGRLMADGIYVTRSGGTSTGSTSTHLRGTVRSVDTVRRTITLDQANWIQRFDTGMGSGSVIVLQYDTNTRVEFQGQLYEPTNLERGDVIEVQTREVGSGYHAERIVVVRDVNSF